MKKVLIIGAGPAGLAAAYLLTKNSIDHTITVAESSPFVGGLARSFKLWDRIVDVGPHRFFSYDKKVNELWLEAAGKNYHMVERTTRIFYKNKFYNYPIKLFNALSNLGPFEAVHCVLSYILVKIFPRKDRGDFESWVIARFGYRLFNIFFKTYTEKVWGITTRQLHGNWASQRIKNLSLLEAVKNVLVNTKQHQTLADRFAYPDNGAGQVYENIHSYIVNKGVNVLLKTKITNIRFEGSKWHAYSDTIKLGEYDEIISSMPITNFIEGLPDVPDVVVAHSKKLKFRNTILAYIQLATTKTFPDQWIYVHSPELLAGRITNYNNFGSVEQRNTLHDTILSLEYWAFEEDLLWQQSNAELARMAKRELIKTGLVKEEEINNIEIYKIPKSYPVYDMTYEDHLNPVIDYLNTLSNCQLIGRYGSFKYNNQDHSILMGILAAENIMYNANHNLWDINTDDDYQEKTTITESGLE